MEHYIDTVAPYDLPTLSDTEGVFWLQKENDFSHADMDYLLDQLSDDLSHSDQSLGTPSAPEASPKFAEHFSALPRTADFPPMNRPRSDLAHKEDFEYLNLDEPIHDFTSSGRTGSGNPEGAGAGLYLELVDPDLSVTLLSTTAYQEHNVKFDIASPTLTEIDEHAIDAVVDSMTFLQNVLDPFMQTKGDVECGGGGGVWDDDDLFILEDVSM